MEKKEQRRKKTPISRDMGVQALDHRFYPSRFYPPETWVSRLRQSFYNMGMNKTTPDICDEFAAEIQILEPLFTEYGCSQPFYGEIVTIKCFEDNSLVKQTLAGDGHGKVLVVDGGGSLRCALLGDMLAAMAAENGWQGVVINGCVRDVEILRGIELGVRALNCYPLKSDKRNEGQLNVPVRFAGVDFRLGQHLYADENGIIVAPQALKL